MNKLAPLFDSFAEDEEDLDRNLCKYKVVNVHTHPEQEVDTNDSGVWVCWFLLEGLDKWRCWRSRHPKLSSRSLRFRVACEVLNKELWDTRAWHNMVAAAMNWALEKEVVKEHKAAEDEEQKKVLEEAQTAEKVEEAAVRNMDPEEVQNVEKAVTEDALKGDEIVNDAEKEKDAEDGENVVDKMDVDVGVNDDIDNDNEEESEDNLEERENEKGQLREEEEDGGSDVEEDEKGEDEEEQEEEGGGSDVEEEGKGQEEEEEEEGEGDEDDDSL